MIRKFEKEGKKVCVWCARSVCQAIVMVSASGPNGGAEEFATFKQPFAPQSDRAKAITKATWVLSCRREAVFTCAKQGV